METGTERYPLSHPRPARYRLVHAPSSQPLIGLSVAVGRFVEALFWAIARVVGAVAGVVLFAVAGLVLAGFLARAVWRRGGR